MKARQLSYSDLTDIDHGKEIPEVNPAEAREELRQIERNHHQSQLDNGADKAYRDEMKRRGITK